MKPLQVLLADRHALVRAGLRALIDRIDGVEVVGEAGDADEALRLIKELRPELVLLDIGIPGMNGFEVLEKNTRQFPEVRMIVLAESRGGAIRALRAGAAGYLPKSANSTELVDAITTVARGETYVPPETSKQTLVGSANDRELLTKLTRRQRQVLAMIVDGYTTKRIGLSLNISVKTVETYRAQLMERLNIHDVAGLVRFAIKTELTDIE